MKWAVVIFALTIQAAIAAPGYDNDVKQEEIVLNGIEGDIHKTLYVKEEIHEENTDNVNTESSNEISESDSVTVTESPEPEQSAETQTNEPTTSAIDNAINFPQVPTEITGKEVNSPNEKIESTTGSELNSNVLEIHVLADSMKKAFDNEVDRLVAIAEKQAATELSRNEPLNEITKLHNLYHVLANMKSANEHQNAAIDKSLQEIQNKIQEHKVKHHEHHNHHDHHHNHPDHHHNHPNQPKTHEVLAEIEIIAEPQELEFIWLPEVETVMYEIPLQVQPTQTSYRYPARQNYYYPQLPTQQYVEPIYYEHDLISEPAIVDQEPAPEIEEVEEQITSKTTVDRGADPKMDVVKRQETYQISHSTNVRRPSLSPHHQHPQYYYVH